VVVAAASDGRLQRREQGSDVRPLGIGQLPVRDSHGGERRDERVSRAGVARAVTPLGDGLVRPAPARPAQSEDPLRAIHADGGVYAQTPEISVLERSRAAGDRFEVPVVTGKSAPARVWHTIPPDRFVRAYHEGCDGERPLAYGHFPVFDRWHKGLCRPHLWLSAQGDSSNLPIIGSFPESSRAGKA